VVRAILSECLGHISYHRDVAFDDLIECLELGNDLPKTGPLCPHNETLEFILSI